jgi:hypothetical protein
MKIKMIEYSGDVYEFESRINLFIIDKKVIDIKYQTNFNNIYKSYSAMILYESIDKNN